jgi:DNA-binding NtrC family response regulator
VSFQIGLAQAIGIEGFTTATAGSLKEAREELARSEPDVLFIDLNLPDGTGLDLLQEMKAMPETVLVTGQASMETAVQGIRRGVADYLTKPVDFTRVKRVLGSVLRTRELKGDTAGMRDRGRLGDLIGETAAMQRVYDLICRVAKTEAAILVTGDTGTGKELVAQTVHQLSRRRQEPFLPVNCGALSPSVTESELFGHERGSFTGADRLHKGCFERAHRGTLFLDEITEMPLELQVKLLRLLETSEVTRLGGSEPIRIDVRVIAATNRLPAEAVGEGQLRADLLYRLNVFPIHVPNLWERREDIGLLAEYFLGLLNEAEGTSKHLTAAAMEQLRNHHWPGNVRELRNVLQRAFILAEDAIGDEGLLSHGIEEDPSPRSLVLNLGISVPETERRLILATLESFGGDKRKSAQVLKISLKKLYNRLREYAPKA